MASWCSGLTSHEDLFDTGNGDTVAKLTLHDHSFCVLKTFSLNQRETRFLFTMESIQSEFFQTESDVLFTLALMGERTSFEGPTQVHALTRVRCLSTKHSTIALPGAR